jgi:putative ABC transport system ATP-binding protein
VMVTHDASAAATADEVLFLADGKIVDRHRKPSIDDILDHLRALA